MKTRARAGAEYALLERVEPGGVALYYLRSTESEVVFFEGITKSENLQWRRAPVGETWTVFNMGGRWTVKVTVEAVETVTVKAGTFDGCYKFHKQVLNSTAPRPEAYEWVKPGLGMVKVVDYFVEDNTHPPITTELQSWNYSGQ